MAGDQLPPLRPMDPEATGPLRGIRVLDVTHAAAGPVATMFLADLGADVIKVEPPSGELARFAEPFLPDDEARHYGGRFANRNRNKRAIALDLASADDRSVFLDLVETADAVVENMRAGVLERLGVGWEVCRARNPALVYVAIRGFGDARTGASPYRDWPAYDVVAQAMGGVVAMTGPDRDHPMRAGPLLGDVVPGLQAALGVCAALIHARATGEGQFVDVAMVDAVAAVCEPAQTAWDYEGVLYEPSGNGVGDVIPFDVYRAADGWCAIAAPTEHLWVALCRAMGRDDLAEDPALRDNTGRVAQRTRVEPALRAWVAARPVAEIVSTLGGVVPVGPVQNAPEWRRDPHFAARGMLVEVEHPHHRPTVQLACPIRFTATPSTVHLRPPILDEHGAEIRAELRRRPGAP